MIILMVLGILCHSFYNVEIISVYAFFGLLMIPLYKVKKWVLLVLVSFLILGGPRLIQSVNHNLKTATEKLDTEEPSV